MTVISCTLDAYLTLEYTPLWWNVNYPYRRQIEVVGPAQKDFPVLPALRLRNLINLNKLRSDYADLAILYLHPDNSWSVLGYSINSIKQLEFAIQADLGIKEIDNNYYIYYGNPNLIDAPTAPTYTENLWPLTTNITDTTVSFTRPGQDWINGLSSIKNAKATFTFTGNDVEIISDTGMYGKMLVQIDDNEWNIIDLYSNPPQSDVVVFSQTDIPNIDKFADLQFSSHTVRIRTAAQKFPSSNSITINVKSFKSRPGVTVNDLGEQTGILKWGSV